MRHNPDIIQARPAHTRASGGAGHTLVEAIITMAVFSLVVVGIGGMLNHGFASARALEDQASAAHQAQTYMSLLLALPYGDSEDGYPGKKEMKDFFENYITDSGLTFMNLKKSAEDNDNIVLDVDGLQYDLAIEISSDLNDDGDTSDPNEGTAVFFRIEIFYNNNSLLRTYRAAPAVEY